MGTWTPLPFLPSLFWGSWLLSNVGPETNLMGGALAGKAQASHLLRGPLGLRETLPAHILPRQCRLPHLPLRCLYQLEALPHSLVRGKEEHHLPSRFSKRRENPTELGLMIFPFSPWFSAGGGGEGRSGHSSSAPS